jgi:hypothetical protein
MPIKRPVAVFAGLPVGMVGASLKIMRTALGDKWAVRITLAGETCARRPEWFEAAPVLSQPKLFVLVSRRKSEDAWHDWRAYANAIVHYGEPLDLAALLEKLAADICSGEVGSTVRGQRWYGFDPSDYPTPAIELPQFTLRRDGRKDAPGT